MNGSDTHIEIRLKIRGVETDLRRLGEQLESQEQTLAETLADRDRCFVELAELYLPELGREAVDALRERLPLVYRNARQKLDEKEAEGRSLERRAADNQARRSNLDEQLDGVTEKLEVKVRERQALRQAIRAELEANADYVGLARQDRRLSARLRQQRRRLEAARADLEEKGPAFEDDPLFSYLQARGYATPAYRGGFLTRRLDRRVAERVDFEKQKRRYDRLVAVHRAMQLEAEKLGQERSAKTARLDAIEQEAANRHGLTPVLEAGQALYEERSGILSEIEGVDAERQQITARQTALANTRGDYYGRVIEETAGLLQGRETADLRALASSTSTRSDDGLVDRIGVLAEAIARSRDEAQGLRERRVDLARRLAELRRVENVFRLHDFDAGNSRFLRPIGDLLDGFLQGDLDCEHVITNIKRRQYFKAEPSRSPSGLFGGLPLGNGGFGGGGSSRRRRSSGGGTSRHRPSGRGGFSTGGGF